MKEKIYVGKSLAEIEELAVTELGVSKDDLYFDVTSEERDEVQVHVMVDANPVKKGKDYIENYLREADIYGFVERKMRDNVVEYDINTEIPSITPYEQEQMFNDILSHFGNVYGYATKSILPDYFMYYNVNLVKDLWL